ncbi:MAG TPA: hypothetical protein IAA71_10850 [Candidatus Pullichristensenella stercoripullorum]|nr:hypothetical protein [Candidatus Pullichristensenella stercoripullorum]
MKRICTALLALLLLLGGAHAEEDIFAATIVTPTPTAGVGSIGLAISEYTYAVLTNDTLGVRFSYPSHWIQTPGRRTICYEEPVGEGDIPARMAVSVKQLDDRADGDELTRQLSSFVSAIFTQFDRYEIGNLITDVPFMGKTAYSTVYRGYKGDQVIRGTAIMASVGTKIYAFHFSCDADDYDAMTTVMEYLRSHVEANNS